MSAKGVYWGIYALFLVLISLALHPVSVEGQEAKMGIDETFSTGFIRVCTRDGDHFETRAKNCPKGVFLKEPILPGCVCMQGTWVLHATLCDTSPYIFYGEIEQEYCYQLDFPIQSFLYLGNPFNIFESRTFVAPHSLTVFTEIFNGTDTPVLNYHWPSVVAINPYTNVEGIEKGKKLPVCFERREFIPKRKKIKIHIWDNGFGPSSYRVVMNCSKGAYDGGYDDFAGTHTDFYYRSNKKQPLPVAGCAISCDKVTTTTTTTVATSTFFFSLLELSAGGGGAEGRKKRSGSEMGPSTDGIENEYLHMRPKSVLESPNAHGNLDDDRLQNLETRTTTSNSLEADGTTPKGFRAYRLPTTERASAILNRQKRYKLRETLHTVWNGIGFCMQSYWDPKVMFHLDADEEMRCYPNVTATPPTIYKDRDLVEAKDGKS